VSPIPLPWSSALEKALRRAAVWHREQTRKGSVLPYIQHPVAVAMILDRLGFAEDVVIAGLLHDAVEDTEATLELVSAEFGEAVAGLVAWGSEVKLDASGQKRPWEDRKRDHLAALAGASAGARAVVLADKLHNLLSMRDDLAEGIDLWRKFNAPRDRVLWYYRSMAESLGRGDERLERLAGFCLEALNAIEAATVSSGGPDGVGSAGAPGE
jgi:(p)ppGpp synthase/HD superfamily hydrolase